MKRKIILCLTLITLFSFNLIACMGNQKDIDQKNEQQENISNENSNTDKKDMNQTDTSSASKPSENNKIVNNNKKDKVVKENNNDPKTTQESKKQIYKDKLDNIQSGMKDLEGLQAGGNEEMKSAAYQEYKRWDNALNEIYGVLKQQLSSDDMNKLKDEEIKWISYRDDKAKKDSLEYEGGRLEQLSYRLSLAKITKERCYELVEKYMK